MNEEDRHIITMTKAVGIILMVLAHTLTYGTMLRSIIYTFHMPLFFIMSGYCFKDKYLSNSKLFLIHKIKGIYVPYVLFALPFLAMHNVFCRLNIYESDWLYGWKDFVWNAGRILTRMSMNEGLLGTFWFLKELFWGNLIFYVALRLSKGKIIPVMIGLLVLAEVLCVTQWRIPYFNIKYTSVLAACFISCGYWWRIKSERIGELLRKWWIWLCGIALIVGELILFYAIDFLHLTAESLPIYIFPAIAGTMIVFELCRMVYPYIHGAGMRTWEFIGNHTLSIMALHFLAFKTVSLSYIKLFHLPLERLSDFPVISDCLNVGWTLLYTFVGVSIPLMCALGWQRVTETMNTLKNE